MFADDTVIYLNGNPSQFKYVFDILRTFSDQTECKVNINKSNAFYVSLSRGNGFKPFSAEGLSWLTNTIKHLGAYIPINHFDNNSIISENFSQLLMKLVLNIWSSRKLTRLRKITAIKSMAIPKLVYKASNLPAVLPDTFIKQVNQILFGTWVSNWKKLDDLNYVEILMRGELK